MQEGQASRTADRVAERRAAHQVRDRPLVLDDPIALRIIRPEVAHELRTNPPTREATKLGPYLRAFFVMRSRFAEDALASAVADGVRQYVVLGAGFDTFAYRNPFPGCASSRSIIPRRRPSSGSAWRIAKSRFRFAHVRADRFRYDEAR